MNTIKKELGFKLIFKFNDEVRIYNNGERNVQNNYSSLSTNQKKRKLDSIINENEIEKPFKKLISSSSTTTSSSSSTSTSTSTSAATFNKVPVNKEEQQHKESTKVPENSTFSESFSDYNKCEDHDKYQVSCARCQAIDKISRELVKDGIIIKEIIGKGGFGTVFKGSFKNEWVAVKIFFKEKAIDDYENELKYLQMIKSHPNLIEFKFTKKYGNVGVIIYELLNQSLSGFKKENQEYFRNANNREKLYSVVKGMAFGLEALHEMNIVHVDLHPGNVLMDFSFNVKITDFGISKIQDEEDTIRASCALKFRPPEAARGKENSRAFHKKYSDIYQFGLMMQHLVSKDGSLVEIPSVYQQLYMNCMNRIPSRRPSIKDIVKIVSKW